MSSACRTYLSKFAAENLSIAIAIPQHNPALSIERASVAVLFLV